MISIKAGDSKLRDPGTKSPKKDMTFKTNQLNVKHS